MKIKSVSLRASIDKIIKEKSTMVIEKERPRDKRITYYVLLKKNLKSLAVIEKVNPKNENELIVSYYVNNVLCYDIIDESHILPIDVYEQIKNRNNRINKILRD